MTDRVDVHWTLDKRVPLALILAIVAQSFGAIWWAATTSARITAVEDSVRTSVTDRLNRIENKLDRLIEDRRPDHSI